MPSNREGSIPPSMATPNYSLFAHLLRVRPNGRWRQRRLAGRGREDGDHRGEMLDSRAHIGVYPQDLTERGDTCANCIITDRVRNC